MIIYKSTIPCCCCGWSLIAFSLWCINVKLCSFKFSFCSSEALTSLYGVGFDLQSYDITTNTYIFWAANSDTTELHSAVAETVDTLAGTNSLASVLNSELIVNKPVYWSGFGARTLRIGEESRVEWGAGWVDEDGIQFEDNSHYTMSSYNIFGGPMTPDPDSAESLTRVFYSTLSY